MDYKQFLVEIENIHTELKKSITSNPEEIQERLRYAMVQLARSSELQATAENVLNMKKGEFAQQNKNTVMKEVLYKSLMNYYCCEELNFFTSAERLNKTLVHYIDGARSLLSYEKEQTRLVSSFK